MDRLAIERNAVVFLSDAARYFQAWRQFRANEETTMLGYKVMRYDPGTRDVLSAADERLRFRLEVGDVMEMQGNGIYLGTSQEFVTDYYAVNDHNILVEMEFDPTDLLEGDPTSGTAGEIRVRRARVRRLEVLPDEDAEDLPGVKIF
jgi:hypothetical protein